MTAKSGLYKSVKDLLTYQELSWLKQSPVFSTGRYPTWYPIFSKNPTTTDYLSNEAVRVISNEGGNQWLSDLALRLIQKKDPFEASAALAELRAYGALLLAGFTVKPIPLSINSTPDFEINGGEGPIIIEVFTKHQDKSEDNLFDKIQAGQTPSGVERHKSIIKNKQIETIFSEHYPFGKPNENKPHDSTQANFISRMCSIKGDETQLPSNNPSLLWIDLRSIGNVPEFIQLEQCSPLISGHEGITSGGIWNAFYGWKDAPIFEEGFQPYEKQMPVTFMGHDGRFRLSGSKKTKLSGVIVSLCDGVVLLENPWSDNPLKVNSRKMIERIPWFNLAYSICDWYPGDIKSLVNIGRHQIEAM